MSSQGLTCVIPVPNTKAALVVYSLKQLYCLCVLSSFTFISLTIDTVAGQLFALQLVVTPILSGSSQMHVHRKTVRRSLVCAADWSRLLHG